MKLVFENHTLPRRLARAVLYTHCTLGCLLAMHSASAADTTTLPSISVSPEPAGTLKSPTSTGSNLDLTPFQTPASVSVITREQLEQRGDANLVDAITRSAGISGMGHPGNSGSSLSARGFTDTTSVMRLYDGTRQYGGVGVSFPFDTWSIDRIEVLRGPASVIYGDGAIGAVVNVIPKKPTRGAIQNEVQATIGTDNTQRLGFGSGGAINDKLSYRIDLSGDRSDGWVDMGDSRNLSFSGALQLDVSADFRLKLSYAQGRQEPMRYFGTPLVNGQQLEALRKKNYNVSDSKIQYDDRWTELSAEWTPNADTTVRSKLYYIDSKRQWRNAENYVYDSALAKVVRSGDTEIMHDQTQIGNTTDATFRGHLLGLKNQVSVGFDVSSSSFQHTNNLYAGTPNPGNVDPYNPIPGNFVSDNPYIPRYRNKAQQYSIFAENRLELTDKWSVLGGLRYDHADVSRANLETNTPVFDQTYSNVGWRLGTVYNIDPDTALYAQYSEAADPVGGLLMITAANSKFDLSTGKQIEVGIKQAFWGKKGEWTLAAYNIKKNNLPSRDPNNFGSRIQVGQQSSTGLEGTLALAFAPGWQLDANAAILRAKFDEFLDPAGSPPTGTVSRAGNVPPNVAERLANVWLSWNFIPDWTASGGLRYVGKRYADNANTLAMPAYTTTDLALQWKASRDTTVTLRGFNVFDKQYFTTAYYSGTQWFNGPGRRIELTANYRF
jgi:iron complex outermembrane receptor protein